MKTKYRNISVWRNSPDGRSLMVQNVRVTERRYAKEFARVLAHYAGSGCEVCGDGPTSTAVAELLTN